MKNLDLNYVNSQLRYEPETGLLFWKVRKPGMMPGDTAGGLNGKGYINISIGGRLFLAHRVAWLLSVGEWPKEEIDHINHKKTDNRLTNLREASHKENSHNLSLNKENLLGERGVDFKKGTQKYRARIIVNGEEKHLGYFLSISDAVRARLAAEKRYYKNFAPLL